MDLGASAGEDAAGFDEEGGFYELTGCLSCAEKFFQLRDFTVSCKARHAVPSRVGDPGGRAEGAVEVGIDGEEELFVGVQVLWGRGLARE